MIVLDTQVLLYAVGTAHPLADVCARLVRAIGEDRIRATTTAGVIQEFAHVRARRRPREDAAALAVEFVHLLSPLLTVDAAMTIEAMERFVSMPGIDAFDAVLGEATIRAGARALVTADRDFDGFPGLRIWRPDGPELAAVLEGF